MPLIVFKPNMKAAERMLMALTVQISFRLFHWFTGEKVISYLKKQYSRRMANEWIVFYSLRRHYNVEMKLCNILLGSIACQCEHKQI